MAVPEVLQWIQDTELSTAIREGALYYPIIGGVHLLAIALFGGMVLTTDLRLLGWAMEKRAVSDVVRQSQVWKRLGFVMIVASGLLLAWCEPIKLYRSPSFWVKMVLFALVGVHALIFRDSVYRNPEQLDKTMTSQARWAAALSLFLWAGLIVSGRLIAFDE